MAETKRDRYMQESKYIDEYLSRIGIDNALYVDIGCGNITNLSLEKVRSSKQTIFFECDPVNINLYKDWNQPNFKLLPLKATPDNVVGLIKEWSNGGDFKFIDIDIDSYDYFVLRSILKEMSPSIIVAELNEKIPPPIQFAVKYNENHSWDGSHFFGMSISKFYKLAQEFGYDIVRLNFNNVHAIKSDTNHGFPIYSDEEAYEIGYRRPRLNGDAHQFWYNKNVDTLLTMSPSEGIDFLKDHFKGYEGKYELGL